MSEFHGGFLVMRLDAGVTEPIRAAVASYLRKVGSPPEAHTVTFAARRGCPVLHVAIRGGDADGKGYCFFHREHADLGATLASAVSAPVWSYTYENQVGTESVVAFDARGTKLSDVTVSWDDVDDDTDRPLASLAHELGVARILLEMELAYDTPVIRMNVCGGEPTRDVIPYFDALPPAGDAGLETSLGKVTLYFPEAMACQADALATRLDLALGRVFWAAWELAKHEILSPMDAAANGEVVLGPSQPPPELRIPTDGAMAPAPPASGNDKMGLVLALPDRVFRELRAVAYQADRSLSWCLQKAWFIARARVLAAERVATDEPTKEVALFFDGGALAEIEALAKKLHLSVDDVLTAAWELGKVELFASTRGVTERGEEAPPLPAPPVVEPRELVVPASAPQLPPIERSGAKARVGLLLPERVVEELQALSQQADRSQSWMLYAAYQLCRAQLHAASHR